MSVNIQTVLMIVGAIEGFSIWKGKRLLKLPPVNVLEAHPLLSDAMCDKFVGAIKGRKSSANVLWTCVLTGIICVVDLLCKALVWIVNVLLKLVMLLLCAAWHVSDFAIKYSILVSIPLLSYLYLKQIPNLFDGENFLKPEWVIDFIYFKASCYLFVFIISFVSYVIAKVKPRTNSSIGEV